MSEQTREYNGAALNSFILGLGHSEAVIQKLLADAGVDRIDPERWYDYQWAISLYYKIGEEIGRSALIAIGRKMIETAPFPPGIDSIHTLLMSLGAAFRLNARGPDIGDIVCTIEDEHSATLDWSADGPCALNLGILEGACSRYGAKALVEHGATGCKDTGAPTCIYHVSW